jgi:allantoinase
MDQPAFGLQIARRLVEAHSREIRVEQAPGGARFCMTRSRLTVGALPPCDLAISGRVVFADRPPAHGQVRVSGGRIEAVVAGASSGPAERVIDVEDAYVLPGAVDAHVHCLSNPGEGIEAATRAAAAGGVTTIVEMPYDAGDPVDNLRTLEAKKRRVADEAVVDVALLATVRPENGAPDVGALVEHGACGFKLSLFDTDARRFPRIPDVQLLEVLGAIATAGSLACFHAENDEIIKPLIARFRAESRHGPEAHSRSRPPVSETEAVLKALEFAYAARCRIHLCHLSLARSVELARWFATQGLDVTTETCPHYLCFAEDDLLTQKGRLKINPPLRTARDRDGLWAAVTAGEIDLVASDHAPWDLADKTHPDIFDNHSGAPGVETLVPVVLSEGLERGTPIETLSKALSETPAKRFKLSGKGVLLPGYDADLVVFDPGAPGRVDESALHSNAGWSPYHGRRLKGQVTTVISRGEVIFEQGLSVAAGRGRLVVPDASR